MADTIDIAKLKTDAFDAIDALFSENDEDTSFGEQTLENTGPPSDEFAMLDEYTLALDWEYSDKELNRLTRHLDKITFKHPEKHNQSLVKTIKIIINYLQKAKEKAYPQTLNVMAYVITALKDINTKDFDEAGIKLKLNSIYNEIVSLKEKISKYNKKLKKHIAKKKEIKPENISDFKPGSEEKITKTVNNMETKGIDTNILTRLDQLDEKISYLEKQNNALKRLMIDQYQGAAGTMISDFNSGMEEDTDAEFGVDSFSTQKEPFFSIEEPITVDVDDISFEFIHPAGNQ